ncbi:MAG: hypothetical protein IJS78_03945 [Clostridia bacterium]|nr:hypothetical protein [Clostridia bacterium]
MTGVRSRGLSANVLKIIAAVSMAVDHTGAILFPRVYWLRIIGRLAMPIFAWFLAEGMRHTRSPLRYFIRVFTLAVVCQTPYVVFMNDWYFNILFTFSCSIGMMATVRAFREAEGKDKYLILLGLAAELGAAYLLTAQISIDYGFFGVILPVAAYAAEDRRGATAMFALCLAALSAKSLFSGTVNGFADAMYKMVRYRPQPFSLLSIPLLLLYSGKRGKLRMKYFFYIFYPAHLLILWLISLII